MPLAFARFTSNPQTNPTGLLGTDGQLYVLTSGESAALDTLTPELTTSLEAVGGGKGARGIRWAAIIWLLGRVVTYSPEMARQIIENFIIAPAKLGQITDLLLGRARQTNMLGSALRAGQLRVFLRKLAGMQGVPFFCLEVADLVDVTTLYPAVAATTASPGGAGGPPSGGAGPPPGPPPPPAVTAKSILVYGDIAPEALGAFELTVGPRLTGVDRSAQGGFQVVVTMVLQSALQALVPLTIRGTFDIPAWIDARAQVEEFRRAFAGAQPPEQLEVLHAGLVDARRRLAAGLATSQHDTLTVENILLAVDHHEALIPILGQDSAGGRFCAVAPSAAWTEIRTLCARTGIRASEPVIGDLAMLAAKLSFLTPRFAGADMQQLSPAEPSSGPPRFWRSWKTRSRTGSGPKKLPRQARPGSSGTPRPTRPRYTKGLGTRSSPRSPRRSKACSTPTSTRTRSSERSSAQARPSLCTRYAGKRMPCQQSRSSR